MPQTEDSITFMSNKLFVEEDLPSAGKNNTSLHTSLLTLTVSDIQVNILLCSYTEGTVFFAP